MDCGARGSSARESHPPGPHRGLRPAFDGLHLRPPSVLLKMPVQRVDAYRVRESPGSTKSAGHLPDPAVAAMHAHRCVQHAPAPPAIVAHDNARVCPAKTVRGREGSTAIAVTSPYARRCPPRATERRCRCSRRSHACPSPRRRSPASTGRRRAPRDTSREGRGPPAASCGRRRCF